MKSIFREILDSIDWSLPEVNDSFYSFKIDSDKDNCKMKYISKDSFGDFDVEANGTDFSNCLETLVNNLDEQVQEQMKMLEEKEKTVEDTTEDNNNDVITKLEETIHFFENENADLKAQNANLKTTISILKDEKRSFKKLYKELVDEFSNLLKDFKGVDYGF